MELVFGSGFQSQQDQVQVQVQVYLSLIIILSIIVKCTVCPLGQFLGSDLIQGLSGLRVEAVPEPLSAGLMDPGIWYLLLDGSREKRRYLGGWDP